MTRVILSLQERACLLTRDSSHDSNSSILYFRMRLTQNETSDAATKADMMANVLIQAGLELHTLIDIFEEDREAIQ